MPQAAACPGPSPFPVPLLLHPALTRLSLLLADTQQLGCAAGHRVQHDGGRWLTARDGNAHTARSQNRWRCCQDSCRISALLQNLVLYWAFFGLQMKAKVLHCWRKHTRSHCWVLTRTACFPDPHLVTGVFPHKLVYLQHPTPFTNTLVLSQLSLWSSQLNWFSFEFYYSLSPRV